MSDSAAALRRGMILVVVCGCLISLLGFGIRSGFGLFLAPMSADLGWGREVFALAIAIQNLLWGLGQPLAGAVADRYGAGRVLAVGGVVYAAGVFLMAQATTPLAFHLSAGVLLGFGLSAASFSIVLASIARMVPEEKRSLAMGLGTAAGSLGQFIMVPLGQGFIDLYGWHTALILMSLFALLIVPLARPLRGRANAANMGPEQSFAEALREAGQHSGYLYLTAGFFVCGFHVAFIQTHLPAYVTDMGLDPQIGAWALALVGLFNIVGSLLAGYFGGLYSKKNLLSLIYFGRAAAIAVFIVVPISPTSVLVFSAAMGLLWLSTVPLTSGIVAQVFGPRYMATLFGIVFFSHQLGAFIGVWLGGSLYDATGSYQVVWWIGAALGVFAGLIHLPINERPAARLAAAVPD